MKLITEEVMKELEKYPYLSQDGKGLEAKVIVKFFNPVGAGTWLITEMVEKAEDDIILYGYAELGYGWEWGTVSVNELQNLKLPYGLGIERDLYSKGTVKELIR